MNYLNIIDRFFKKSESNIKYSKQNPGRREKGGLKIRTENIKEVTPQRFAGH